MNKLKKSFLFMDVEQVSIELNMKKIKLQQIIDSYINDNKENESTELFEEQQRIVTDDGDEIEIESDKQETPNETKNSNESVNGDKSDIGGDDKHSEHVESEKTQNLPSDINSIYRSVVKKTHPDKNPKAEYIELYKKCVQAKETNDIVTIILIAYVVGIDEIYDLDLSYFDEIKKRKKSLETECRTIENNSFWIWFHTEHVVIKEMMNNQIKTFLKQKSPK